MDYLTPEQQQERLNICKECPFFKFRDDNITYCEISNLDINLIITDVEAKCPKENW